MSTTENLFGYHRQRAKGTKGEREVRDLLDKYGIEHEWMDYEAQRFEDAKADILTDEFAIEVKRYGKGRFDSQWWAQASAAARHWNRRAAVVYRFDHNEWRMRLEIDGLQADVRFEDWLKKEESNA